MVPVKPKCFCHFQIKRASDWMQISNRLMFVIVMSCTWGLLLGTCTVIEQYITILYFPSVAIFFRVRCGCFSVVGFGFLFVWVF